MSRAFPGRGPKSSVATRLALAGAVWTAVGAGLAGAGVYWLARSDSLAALLVALPVGWAKATYLLAPRARVNVRRILASGEGRCPGGVFPWSTWALVLTLMATGTLLRMSPLPRPWLGGVYVAVGTALAIGSLVAWRAWAGHLRGRVGR